MNDIIPHNCMKMNAIRAKFYGQVALHRGLRLLLMVLPAFSSVFSQFNNEWIDYSKTYYKIKVAEEGIFRVSKTALDAAGIGGADAAHFQLWINGTEIPLYTSSATGPLPSNGYIEFYGEKNNGALDRTLYRTSTDYISGNNSLFTDTAVYFLTINTVSANKRYQNIANNLSSALPTPAANIWKKLRHNYINRTTKRPYINRGLGVNFGETVYSSSFERGEMPSSDDIYPPQNGNDFSNKDAQYSNLLPYAAGGLSAKVRTCIAGAAQRNRNVRVSLGGTTIYERFFNTYEARIDSATNVSPALLQGTPFLEIRNLNTDLIDRVVAGFSEIEYPRVPDAGNSSYFRYYLPATSGNTYVELANFAHGGQAPVLYNLTTGTRMMGELSAGGLVRLLIPAASSRQEFVLLANAGAVAANTLKSRVFINFNLAAEQGNFLMISNPVLMGGTNNPVEQYRAYRSSTLGGGFAARVYDIEQLVDQFAYGVKMHPLSIKNFLRFARQRFSNAPKFCLLIGKGVTYDEFRAKENSPLADKLQLVPTFGYPASDNLLASDNLISLPAFPIGRLSVVSPTEVADYLNKVKEYEANQRNPANLQAEKRWMKNVVHVVGANDAGTESLIRPYMDEYARIARDTLYGGAVTTFNKFNTTTASTIENEQLANLFQIGFSLMTYFGHSSATALDYNLDDPGQYNNPGKYPVFLLNGCNAGNFYDFEESRLQTINTISEKYVLAKNRGAIGMIASTHFGIVSGLGVYSNGFYRSVASQNYYKPVGQNATDAINYLFQTWGSLDFVGRIHAEQQTLHGDPSIRVNGFDKPDYSIENQNVNVNPSFVSIAESNFKVKAYYYNIGRAINDSITVEVKRQYPISQFNPTGATEVVLKKKVKAVYNIDSLEITLPILPDRDKGINKITVSLDTENKVEEGSETNNSNSTDITIFEDELRPVFPYNFSIVNQSNTKLIGSASNPFSSSKNYRMELDTSAFFNSSAKVTRNLSAAGNLLEFDPGVVYRDSTVYYWRLGLVNANGSVDRWNSASFAYLAGTETGFNQSHFYQHTKSTTERMALDSGSRQWQFSKLAKQLLVSHSVFGTPGYVDDNSSLSVSVNSSIVSASACVGHSMIFNVFDGLTFKPLANPNRGFGSGPFCQTTRLNNFEWDDRNKANRDSMMRFMDAIPNGAYVVVRKILDSDNGTYNNETFADQLKADETINGAGNSLYHKLKQAGFSNIDSFNRPRIYIFIYRKGDASFAPRIRLSEGINDRIQINTTILTSDTMGVVTSPAFGPAKAWKTLKWRGRSLEAPASDRATVQLVGISATGAETVLQTLSQSQQDVNISNFSATQYPFMRLRMTAVDSINGTPYQLNYWRLYYDPVPEGALGSNLVFQGKDSLVQGEPYDFRIAFKNISPTPFADSLRLKLEIRDKANNLKTIALPRKKALQSGDTTIVSFTLDTKDYTGLNNLYLAVNPDNAQPEQFFFNNYLYRAFYVAEDKTKPLLDVTFDGVHILNRDIVSAKPHIEIKLKDENRFLALNDTAGVVVKLRYPNDNNFRTYRWGTDTLQFVAASSSADNTATINFFPALTDDTEGGEYELQVSGKDRNTNRAGNLDYSVAFQVFNKPMISNLLNYPNPFSTSTAFVFTITGAEVPQEFKIQILTITGKIVKEITRQELGNLRIGTNVTDYKWDGTDTYGQKLANGVYIYRVISSLDGKKMEKFRLNEGFDQNSLDVTDQFFNKKGYGKLVILR